LVLRRRDNKLRKQASHTSREALLFEETLSISKLRIFFLCVLKNQEDKAAFQIEDLNGLFKKNQEDLKKEVCFLCLLSSWSFNGLGFLLACFQSLLFVIPKEKKEY